MKKYIGTKIIKAQENEDEAGEDGYLVEYEDGYKSWSPKKAFEDAYRRTDGMNFGLAIEAMKKGCRVCRTGWNGKDMYICLTEGSSIRPEDARTGACKALADEGFNSIDICPHIDMRAADGSIVVGWLASQTDMLSDDWEIVE